MFTARREFLKELAGILALFAEADIPVFSSETPVHNQDYPAGSLQSVPNIPQRAEWRRFIIFVWQYENDVLMDTSLYKEAGLRGFHIDRGNGEETKVNFSLKNGFPYYVDHTAGKGILYLARDVQRKLSGVGSLQMRPHSLADPKTIEALKSLLNENIATTKNGLVYAYAFDDEISLGAFNNPIEVDVHSRSISWFRRWLMHRYGNIGNLNASWGTPYATFESVHPTGFEQLRRQHSSKPFSSWNLSRWMEWRHFMDYQFAQVLSALTRFANELDPSTPAGFVGGQQPSAYGGYDYALLSRAVQWMEAADMGGKNEILRSFWNRPRRPRVQTYDARHSYKQNVWTLWSRLAHGQQANIAWPHGWFRNVPNEKRQLSGMIRQLAPTFREIQGRAGEFIVNRDSYLDTDPIALYYSQPSIRAGWVMDCIPHGATWPRRMTGIDDDNLSSARLRLGWCKLLEDLGYQYDFISYLDVQESKVDLAERFKIIILNQIICLSDREAERLKDFVHAGGVLIADAFCGILNENGRGRRAGALDELFGVIRAEAEGYFSGTGITEVNAERYQMPFHERLNAYNKALRYKSMIVVERGTRAITSSDYETVQGAHVIIGRKVARGHTLYLNLSPLGYAYFPFRAGPMGAAWRAMIGRTTRGSGLRSRVEIYGPGGEEMWMERLLWRNGDRYCLAIVKNIPESGDAPEAASIIEQEPQKITVRLNLSVRDIQNVRTGKRFGNSTFEDILKPWEANLYEFTLTKE